MRGGGAGTVGARSCSRARTSLATFVASETTRRDCHDCPRRFEGYLLNMRSSLAASVAASEIATWIKFCILSRLHGDSGKRRAKGGQLAARYFNFRFPSICLRALLKSIVSCLFGGHVRQQTKGPERQRLQTCYSNVNQTCALTNKRPRTTSSPNMSSTSSKTLKEHVR